MKVRRRVIGLLGGAAILAAAPAAAGAATTVKVKAPATAKQGSFGIQLSAPGMRGLAGFETQVLVNGGAAEVGALVPSARGAQMLEVGGTRSRARVGFYGARGVSRRGGIGDVLITPKRRGTLVVRLVGAVAVTKSGKRIPITLSRSVVRVRVLGGGKVIKAARPLKAKRGVRRTGFDVNRDGAIAKHDLDSTVYAWALAQPLGRPGVPARRGEDTNGDARIDIADVQGVAARRGSEPRPRNTRAGELTLVVNSVLDTPDGNVGDGVCATVVPGECTLRAALQEANARAGLDYVNFNIPGPAPHRITITSRLEVTDQQGGVIVDAYSQPGARVNNDPVVSNAIPGIEIYGYNSTGQTGWNWKDVAFYVTSSRNTFRGFAFTNVGRAFLLYWTGARNNRIVGNWIGLTGQGTNTSSRQTGYLGIHLNNAQANIIGTPALADRNVFAGFSGYQVGHFGISDVDNVTQNNLFGFDPTGTLSIGRACDAVDHNTGPKRNLTGGLGPREGNVFGRFTCDAVEFSHGWDPALADHSQSSPDYRVADNRVQGNWIGYWPNGSWSTAVQPGSTAEQDGAAVNIIDYSDRNLVEGNYMNGRLWAVSSWGPTSDNNIIRNNRIGVAPDGSAAPTGQFGVHIGATPSLTWRYARGNQVIGNHIANATIAGIGVEHVSSDLNRLSRNTFANVGPLAIDLGPRGTWEPNDAGDTDSGPNQNQNYPVITAANTATVSGTSCAGCTVEVFKSSGTEGGSGIPTAFLASVVVPSSGTWQVTVPANALAVGDLVSATASTSNGNTSEVGANRTVVEAPPPPPADAPVATDAFGRTVANGWGSAELGGAWTIGGTSSTFGVTNGRGWMRVPTATESRNAFLLGTTIRDQTVTTDFAYDRAPTGGNVTASVALRRTSSGQYRFNARVTPAGAVYLQIRRMTTSESAVTAEVLVPGLTAAPNIPIALRAEAVGTGTTALRFKAWPASAAEPSTWNIQATDSTAGIQGAGSVGYRMYTAGSTTAMPLTVSWDNLAVRPKS